MAGVLVDTSALYALLDRQDENHAAAKTRLRSMKKSRLEPIMTNYLVAESHALLLTRLGATIARQWLFSNAWRIERVTESDEAKAIDIIRDYGDKDFSYTDATSFAVMERIGLKRAFAFDRHFRQYGIAIIG